MDPENENQEESLLDDTEKPTETESCPDDNFTTVTQPLLAGNGSSADESASDMINSESHDTCNSPPSNANPCLESDPKSSIAQENLMSVEPPSSIHSDDSSREISLDFSDADGNLKDTNGPDEGANSSELSKNNSRENSAEGNASTLSDVRPIQSTEDTNKENDNFQRNNSDDNSQEESIVTPAGDRPVESDECEKNDSDGNLMEQNTVVPIAETCLEGSENEKSNVGEDAQGNISVAPAEEDMDVEGDGIEKSSSGNDSQEQEVDMPSEEDMHVEGVGVKKSISGIESQEQEVVVPSEEDMHVEGDKVDKSNSGNDSQEQEVFVPSAEDMHVEGDGIDKSNSGIDSQEVVAASVEDMDAQGDGIEKSNSGNDSPEQKVAMANEDDLNAENDGIEKSNLGNDSPEQSVAMATKDDANAGGDGIEKSNLGKDSPEQKVVVANTDDTNVEDLQEKNVSSPVDNICGDNSRFENSNSDEDLSKKNVSSLLCGEMKIDEVKSAGDAGPYIIDTSIFPGPPTDKDKVVVANCFQMEDITSADCQIFPSKDSDVQSYSGIKFPSTKKDVGPSEDREDISDEEFDEELSANTDAKQPVHSSSGENISEPSVIKPGYLRSESFISKSDNMSVNSSETGDIIDLKLEDAALKSLGSSCDTDDNRHSKVSNEDLEAVSDDELPIVPQVTSDTVSNQHTTNFLDDREEVSSSEDEELDRNPNSDMFPISSGDEFPGPPQNAMPASSPEHDKEHGKTESLTRLESLEAEPISDEEDNTMTNDESKQASFDDGEAGEIKSPALGSPISEQGDMMLGEMEPVSADEGPDTDGELPSGDEDKKFESIDSDDDIGGGDKKVESGVVKKGGEYMETISDEENLDGEDSDKKHLNTSNKESVSAVHKESAIEKGHIPTSFNEHQVELDYEEAYGEDGEAKTETKDDDMKAESKQTDGEEGEHVDEEQGLASDKDEGELSDDDCEEGEIKEPGLKKMFIKPICRFFQRGNCTWGINCRFLHPGINDKGNYQMIEIPGFKPVGIRARLGIPGQYTEQQPPEEEAELPPPPMPDVPHVETAWERGLRIAKEQRKKASERKEKEPDFEEKRLNLSVDEERELNKENERTPKIIPKDPYYDQQAYEVDEYYKIPRDPWHTGHYENFEVRYHQENAYSPPYREKPPPAPPMRYNRPLSPPPIDKFGRHREERPVQPERQEPLRVSDYPPVAKHPDEWIDPWRRSKSPKQQRKPRSRSRGRRNRRSVSDSSDSSRSNSRSSSGSSRSSRSGSSSGSSSRSRSPEPAPPGVDRMDRPDRYGSDQPRSMVSVRGPENQRGGYNRYDNNSRYQRGGRPYSNRINDNRNMYKSRQDNNMYQGGGGGRGGGMGYYGNHANNYRNMGGRGGSGGGGGVGGMPGGYTNRDPRSRDGRYGRNMSPSRGGRGVTPDRPLPYTRPRLKSRSSSRSSSSRSRSRSRSKSSDSSRSRSSSNSSRSSSSSSSSGGSADSEHLYRDLGSPSKNPRHPAMAAGQKKRSGADSRKDRSNAKSNHAASGQAVPRHLPPQSNVDRIPHPRSPPLSRADPKYSQIPLPPSGGRADAKYASRNAPQPLVKAKDPLKVVGQKSNIKLTLLPKQQQPSGLGDRPNPLASPPHKRRMSDRDPSPTSPPPPAKRPNVSLQASSLRATAEKNAKLMARQEKAKSPPVGSLPPPPSSSVIQRSKNPPLPPSPQKQPASKLRTTTENASAKPAAKAPSGSAATANPSSAKSKKSMSSRREELLKQLKAVEDAIARKKVKMS